MRQAFNDVGWLTSPAPTPDSPAEVYGFSLGYDFAAQHEYGAPYIREALGVPEKDIPVGIEDRTMTKVPSNLGLLEYEHRSADRRSKRTVPAALLYCSDHGSYVSEVIRKDAALLAKSMDAAFIWDIVKDKAHYNPEKHDVVCAWSGREGFAIHVRGVENVRRLKELHQALQNKAVSLADPVIVGFSRKSLALVMHERLPPEVWQSVREKDEAHARLHQAAEATGVEAVLRAAGLKWRVLRPAWVAGVEGRLQFWLSTDSLHGGRYGWFSEHELRQWAQGHGPVLDSRDIEVLLKSQDPDWTIHLMAGLKTHRIAIERGPEFVWRDKAAGTIGVVLELAGETSAAGLTPVDGAIYALESLAPYVAEGKALQPTEAQATN